MDLIRWARRQSGARDLKPLEGHVLVTLATYANKQAVAWPSIRTLAIDCGVRPTKDGRNSAVSAALARLEDLGLVWTKQGGHGAPAKRELLYRPDQPSVVADGNAVAEPPQPSGTPDGTPVDRFFAAFRSDGPQPSGTEDQKEPGNGQNSNNRKTTTEGARGSLPATRKASDRAHRGFRKLPVIGEAA